MAMNIDDDEVRRRAYRIWEAEGRAPCSEQECFARARAEIESEFRRAVEQASHSDKRINPPLQVEEALDPGLWRRPGGEKLHNGSKDRGN
ncbi:MAG: DUF2934 domain-containing protein [Solirubrobacterales bacterium]